MMNDGGKSFIRLTPSHYYAAQEIQLQNIGKVNPGKSYWRGRLSTVDLLVLTRLDQLVFILKT